MIYVDSITITPQNITVTEGDWFCDVSAEICPSDATCDSLIWHSSNPNVASVSENGYINGVSEGSAVIYATAKDGGGAIGFCNVTVVSRVLVSSIVVDPTEKTMQVGDTCNCLSATVYPSNATEKRIRWTSCNPSIAEVHYLTGKVTAKAPGTTCICANAVDESGVYGCCEVTVIPISVNSISVSPKQKTLSPGEVATISTTIYPSNASNRSIIWKSSNTSVATVNNGVVTAKTDGSAIITARTVDGNKTATCKITVDSREKVTIKSDSHSFFVEFADGNIWKNIGMDLSNRQGNYTQLYPPHMWHQHYDELIEEEQRYFDNVIIESIEGYVNRTYSVEQIAYLYLLDPLGIEYYMRTNACDGMSLGESLFFKDRVYQQIFG